MKCPGPLPPAPSVGAATGAVVIGVYAGTVAIGVSDVDGDHVVTGTYAAAPVGTVGTSGVGVSSCRGAAIDTATPVSTTTPASGIQCQ